MLKKLPKNSPILQATFGIERESLRMTSKHRVAQTPHPAKLGSRNFHPYIQTDYSEAQMELITPIASSTKEARRLLSAITDVAIRSMEPTEYLWPLSMPPIVSEEEITVAQLENPYEYEYRVELGKRYGKMLQSMSGIHYNFELGKDLTRQLFDVSGEEDFVAFKNRLYLKLAQNFLHYRWLLTYLYGASIRAELGFMQDDLGIVRSIRNSSYGYVNSDDVHISFASLDQYVTDIEQAVASQQLSAEKEFYSAVRLRGEKRSRTYLETGISYLEFRNFDLDPFDPLGISQETLDSMHLFLLGLLWLEELKDVDQQLLLSRQLNNQIALSHPLTPLPTDADPQPILSAMQAVIEHFELGDSYQTLLDKICQQITQPETTLAGRLKSKATQASYMPFGSKQGQAFHDYAWTAPYALKGYEDMELSTQMLLFDTIQQGIQFEILDESDQFLKLWHKDHTEYVKNANMTSKDNYIVPLAMENKVVTKKILRQAGFPVPSGREFSDKENALRYYGQVEHAAIVIKPKSTNFGLGISIFQEPAHLTDYQKAIDIAFSKDDHILVEEFVSGTEYRFFILDGKCEAVLLRVAANVVGNGTSSIRELVAEKNRDPLRGYDHRSPLEFIQLGDIELLMLEQQGYTPDSILPKGTQAFLRRNSNISTGGDSIDMTEEMDESYKQLAANMAKEIGAWACGVDLIIPDLQKPSTKEEPNCTCIELNFNPAMYLHTYPYKGRGQALTPKILQKLFPELTPSTDGNH